MFKILIFYKDESALERYIKSFYDVSEKHLQKKTKYERIYDNGYMLVRCVKGFHENYKACRSHLIAVQEELTWVNKWHDIRRCILTPMLMSPIPIQVFDGICIESYNQ